MKIGSRTISLKNFSFRKITRKQALIGSAVVALLLILLLKGSGDNEGELGDEPRQRSPVAVQVGEVRSQRVVQTVTAAGKIRPVFETEISSTVSAQIMELRIDEGDDVQAGDTLVVLDRLRYEAAHSRAKSGLRSARAGLRKITAERERGRQLYEKQLISLQDMEALEASLESSLSLVDQATATLQQARDDLDKTVLLAPEGGVVTKLNKELGEMALGSTFQADVLLIISDLSSMEVVVEVDETDVVDIEILDLVQIELDAIQDTVFLGRVSKIAHSAVVQGQGTQEQATSFEVVVTLDVAGESRMVDPRIRPGMSATATITTALHEAVVAVPIQALTARVPEIPPPGELANGDGIGGRQSSNGPPGRGRRRGRRGGEQGRPGGGPPGRGDRGFGFERPEPVEVVFVVVKDSTGTAGGFLRRLLGKPEIEIVEQRQVKLGISSDTHYEILTGLSEGEEIVVGNYRAVSKELRAGSQITRKESRSPRRRSR